MRRRDFIKKAGSIGAAAIAAPYILPSGRLFAATGSQMAKHVVYVLFAGGVRQQESVLQRYLADSQGLQWEGNIMYNMLSGAPPQAKIAYGTDPQVGPSGAIPIPKILNQTLQEQGTLFPEVKAANGGHYGGLNTLITGNSSLTQGLRQKPVYPTVFEYARRHLGAPASKVWFVGNTINNSVPLLNYSAHQDYGVNYGANMLIPNVTFSSLGQDHLANAKIYHPEEELSHVQLMKQFLDNNWQINGGIAVDDIGNTQEEKQQLKTFIDGVLDGSINIPQPPVSDNGDLRNIGYACAIMREFKPTITVVNMSSVDGCHSNFTGYLQSLHRADHAVGHLWDFIQNDPDMAEMANDTVIIATPEHGRNANPNSILDENDWYGFDHADGNTNRIFSIMAGPGVPSNMVVGGESNPTGRATDNVLTIGEILGFKNEVMASGAVDPLALSLFDRI